LVGTVSQAQSCGDYIPTGSSSIICANTLNCNAFKDQGQGLHESLGTFPKFISVVYFSNYNLHGVSL
jgi:hypothetical protein